MLQRHRSGVGATKGNGVKIPAFNQYRGHREISSLAKASHWGNLRRQNLSSFEVQVGRTAVIDGIVTKMVMVMFCLYKVKHHNLFLLPKLNNCSRGRI